MARGTVPKSREMARKSPRKMSCDFWWAPSHTCVRCRVRWVCYASGTIGHGAHPMVQRTLMVQSSRQLPSLSLFPSAGTTTCLPSSSSLPPSLHLPPPPAPPCPQLFPPRLPPRPPTAAAVEKGIRERRPYSAVSMNRCSVTGDIKSFVPPPPAHQEQPRGGHWAGQPAGGGGGGGAGRCPSPPHLVLTLR